MKKVSTAKVVTAAESPLPAQIQEALGERRHRGAFGGGGPVNDVTRVSVSEEAAKAQAQPPAVDVTLVVIASGGKPKANG